jgi:hypothetical protein
MLANAELARTLRNTSQTARGCASDTNSHRASPLPNRGGEVVRQGPGREERHWSASAGAPLPGPPPQTAWGREDETPVRWRGRCASRECPLPLVTSRPPPILGEVDVDRSIGNAIEFSPLREERAGRGRGRGPPAGAVKCLPLRTAHPASPRIARGPGQLRLGRGFGAGCRVWPRAGRGKVLRPCNLLRDTMRRCGRASE